MKYYAQINSKNILVGMSMSKLVRDEYDSENVQNIEVSTEIFNNYMQYGDNYYIWDGNAVIKNPSYEQEQAELRKQDFLKDFFKVEGFGYYRRQPKGYQSAVESMNVLFNIANVSQGIQAGLIIFYQEPDFSKPEECTEEWLLEHQIIMPAMTLQEFMQLYVAFMTAWNTEEHVSEVENDTI